MWTPWCCQGRQHLASRLLSLRVLFFCFLSCTVRGQIGCRGNCYVKDCPPAHAGTWASACLGFPFLLQKLYFMSAGAACHPILLIPTRRCGYDRGAQDPVDGSWGQPWGEDRHPCTCSLPCCSLSLSRVRVTARTFANGLALMSGIEMNYSYTKELITRNLQ